MSKSYELVFFGSGPVAAASLKKLLGSFDIEAVITKPKPAHHKEVPPVLQLAQEHKLPTYTASNKLQLIEIFDSQAFSSRLGLVVDYGVIIPASVIGQFPLGIVNSHFSLLPEWRGADPITFALLSGQRQTGVSLMLIDSSLDTGQLIAQATYDIEPAEDVISLTSNLIELSNHCLNEVLPKYIDGQVQPAEQDSTQPPSYSRQLTKSDGELDFNKPAEQLEREVRAFLGWPKSRAKIEGQEVIVTKSRVAKDENDGDLVVKCSPGWLEIQELTGPSGRRMSGADFIRGYRR